MYRFPEQAKKALENLALPIAFYEMADSYELFQKDRFIRKWNEKDP